MRDFYDWDFDEYLRRAKNIITKMTDKEDQRICSKWVERLIKLQSNDMEVKKNRNDFFKFMLEVLEGGTSVGSALDSPGHGPLPFYTGEKEDDPLTMTHWSKDGRTYVAVKTLPNNGAIIYMAVSSDPELGWDIPS